MTFDEALERRRKHQHILPMNEQDFRHGWNAALEAFVKGCEDGLIFYPGDPGAPRRLALELEVEVKT